MLPKTGAGARIALYARVSTPEQSLDPQWIDLRSYCQGRGWRVSEYSDVLSGKRGIQRPGFDRMLRDARAHRIDAIVSVRLDRLGRSLSDLCILMDELLSANVQLIFTAQGIDTTTPFGRFTAHIVAMLAELERENLVERTNAGIRAAKAKGKRFGAPPKQFDRQLAKELVLEGYSDRQICERLKVSLSTIKRETRATRRGMKGQKGGGITHGAIVAILAAQKERFSGSIATHCEPAEINK